MQNDGSLDKLYHYDLFFTNKKDFRNHILHGV